MAIAQYEQTVSKKAIALGTNAETPEAFESALWNRLTEARKAQVQHDQWAKQIVQFNSDLLDAKALATQSEREADLTCVRESLFQLRAQKNNLEKAGDAAAHFYQHAESCKAALRKDASRFLRLRLATHLLETQIERFRKESQGPLLQKSGKMFQSITRGSFSGLGAEFNAKDLPILAGVRPDQTKVSVEGLSDGTRDQLYLALRLAALDQHLEKHEPMPLILDDLLITFDNERTTAILPQLADLAKRTQVFLLTHHEHLVELCRQNLAEGQFQFHQLISPSASTT